MLKQNIALLAGDYSGEHVISIRTAQTISNHLDASRYNVHTIVVDASGWNLDQPSGARYPIDLNDFSVTIPGGKIHFDAAFIAIHGSPGEDGKVQGYLDMMGIPYTGCNSIVSAITFNKNYCNKVVKAFGIVSIANAAHLIKGEPYSLGAILDDLQLPVFVKPNESGSSLGASKVSNVEDLLPAIDRAFLEDDQVLVEEYIGGRELTIGVYRRHGRLQTLPATEIISKNEFFDYEAKYTPGVTSEVTPASIPDKVKDDLEAKSMAIYRQLNCVGIVRMDFILRASDSTLYFLEVNTMPGQSENSIVPQQVRAAGIALSDFYNGLLDDVLQSYAAPTVSATAATA